MFVRFCSLKSTVKVMPAPGLLNPGCASPPTPQSFPLQAVLTHQRPDPSCVNFPQTDASRFPLIGLRQGDTPATIAHSFVLLENVSAEVGMVWQRRDGNETQVAQAGGNKIWHTFPLSAFELYPFKNTLFEIHL